VFFLHERSILDQLVEGLNFYRFSFRRGSGFTFRSRFFMIRNIFNSRCEIRHEVMNYSYISLCLHWISFIFLVEIYIDIHVVEVSAESRHRNTRVYWSLFIG